MKKARRKKRIQNDPVQFRKKRRERKQEEKVKETRGKTVNAKRKGAEINF